MGGRVVGCPAGATKPVFSVGEPVGVTVKDAPGDRCAGASFRVR